MERFSSKPNDVSTVHWFLSWSLLLFNRVPSPIVCISSNGRDVMMNYVLFYLHCRCGAVFPSVSRRGEKVSPSPGNEILYVKVSLYLQLSKGILLRGKVVVFHASPSTRDFMFLRSTSQILISDRLNSVIQ